MDQLLIEEQVSASLPSKYGPFTLSLFTSNKDNKEHMVLTCGIVEKTENVLVRIHSECFTGDILGSIRCDCGEQLQMSMSQIANEGRGIIIYLRQEGRGIGLIEKLKAYNLQDQGKDTIDANLALGHKDDERSYEIAAEILKKFQIRSLRLLTNSPQKIEALSRHQLKITERIPLKTPILHHNAFYLLTKVKKMKHFSEESEIKELFEKSSPKEVKNKPVVTLTYAQSLDGAIAHQDKKKLILSSKESLVMTHQLRAQNDAILVGVGTIISDDPLLTVRYCQGKNPLIIVLDSSLRIPLKAQVLVNSQPLLIFTTQKADVDKKNILMKMGVDVVVLHSTKDGRINLSLMLEELYRLGIKTLMVEGGREIITSFINEKQVDKMCITIAPVFVGGTPVLSRELDNTPRFPILKNIIQYKLGNDLIVMGDVSKGN